VKSSLSEQPRTVCFSFLMYTYIHTHTRSLNSPSEPVTWRGRWDDINKAVLREIDCVDADRCFQAQNMVWWFEVLKAMEMSMFVFWVVRPHELVGRYQRFGEIYCLRLQGEDGDNMFLRNVGICLQVHMALQPRRPTSTWWFYVPCWCFNFQLRARSQSWTCSLHLFIAFFKVLGVLHKSVFWDMIWFDNGVKSSLRQNSFCVRIDLL
jgi:hypothetical protein